LFKGVRRSCTCDMRRVQQGGHPFARSFSLPPTRRPRIPARWSTNKKRRSCSSANGTGADHDGARTGSRVAIGRTGFSGRISAFSVPVAVRCIDKPIGTISAGPPAYRLESGRPKSLSKFPANVYQASGPPCRCAGAVMPGVKTASMYCAECFSPALIASGPILATRFP